MQLLEDNSAAAVKKTADCPELEVIPAQGAMYAMVRISVDALTGVKDDTDFAQQLLQEEPLLSCQARALVSKILSASSHALQGSCE